jgi:hypothetical protein
MPEFPAMVYKRGGALVWDGECFDTLIVEDADELEIAQADGWYLGKPPAEDAAAKPVKAAG